MSTSNEIDVVDVVDAAFEPSESALQAGAQRELARLGIREPNAEQMKAALTASRLIYIASAKKALRP
jgi:hypothetical protein